MQMMMMLSRLLFCLQRMRTERDSLKETIEELHCVQAQEGQLTSGTRQDACVQRVT